MLTVIEAADRYRLAGELDLATGPDLLAVIRATADGDGPLRLDVHSLTFMDSEGIHALLEVSRALDGRDVVLAGPSPRICWELELTGVLDAGIIRVEPA
jgi:anti-anti-sigma factor